MNQDGSGHRGNEGAGVQHSVFSRWATGEAKRGRATQADVAPVYMILTCPTTLNRTLFYVPAPSTPPPRRRK